MRSEWAEALATSGKADGDSLKLLLSPLSSTSLEPGQLQEHILPALVYLEHCGGQHVEPLLSALSTKLQQLASACDQPANPNSPELYAKMLGSLGSVMRSNDLSLGSRTELSSIAESLIQAAVQQAVTGRDAGQAATVGDCLIRGQLLSHEPALPILPSSAGKLLSWANTNWLKPMVNQGAQPTLPCTEAVLHCIICAANAANPAVVASRGPAAAPAADTCDEQVLLEVLDWCRGVMQGALSNFTSDESVDSTHLSGELTRGAARLCVAAAGALVYADVSPSLPSFWAASDVSRPARGSKASLSSTSRRFDSRAESFRSTCSSSPFEVGEVLDDLLSLVETCVSAALTKLKPKSGERTSPAAEAAARDKVLGSVAGMMEGVGPVLAWAAEQGTTISSYLAQVKSMLLATAAGTSHQYLHIASDTGNGNRTSARAETADHNFWSWDLHQPLPASLYKAGGGTVGPAGSGQLLLLLAETLSQGLVAAWQNGQKPVVHALLLPPEPAVADPTDVKVTTLVSGRVYVLLEAEPELSSTVLPLLLDSWASCLTTPATAASLAGTGIQPDVFACVTSTLSEMASWSVVCRSREAAPSAAYNQVSNILLRMYRDTCIAIRTQKAPSAPALQRLQVLADAIAHIGPRLAAEPLASKTLQALQFRLLSLFNDLGLMMGEAGPSEPLGLLLPALAASCGGQRALGAAAGSGSGGVSTVKLSYADLAMTSKQDTNLVKLFRKFWLLVAVHGLRAGAHASASTGRALGQIATSTPLMMVALGAGGDEDILERLKAELGELLAVLGKRADAGRLKVLLIDTVPHNTPKDMPAAAESVAHLLAVSTCELARSTLTALPAPGAASPLSVTLAYLQFSSPRSIYCAWYAHIIKFIYRQYLNHLSTACHQVTPAEVTPRGFKLAGLPLLSHAPSLLRPKQLPRSGLGPLTQLPPTAAQCQEGKEQLAITLISHLTNVGGVEHGGMSKVVEVSWELLQSLIDGDKGASRAAGGSDLLYSPACWQTFLSMLQLEESDKLVGATSGRGAAQVLWKTFTSWVERAALAAPEKTEALLHHFLNQASIPAAVSHTKSGALGTGHATPVNSFAAASAAATRRAADLLGIASKARSKSYLSVGEAKLNTTLELCRKQYYLGLVRGLAAGSSTEAAAQQLLQALKGAVQNMHVSVADLHKHYLCAAAVLVVQEEERLEGQARLETAKNRAVQEGGTVEEVVDDGDAASDQACLSDPTNVEMLQLLVSVPLARFNADMMSLAVFAWTWVSASGPAWLLPLTSRALSGLCQSVDDHVGLFSGPWTPVPKTGMEAALDLETHQGQPNVSEDGLVESLSCHHQWMISLIELWQTVHNRVDAVRDTITRLLLRTLHHALAEPHRLSSHPAAAAPRFRLLQLALMMFLNAARQGTPSASHYILISKAVKAGLFWFLHPSSYSSHLSQEQSEEQFLSIGDFNMQLDRLAEVLKAGGKEGWLGGAKTAVYRPAEHGSSRLETSGSPAAAGSGAAGGGAVSERVVQLLRFLCAREIDRLQVWAKPRASGVEPGTSEGPSRSKRPWESSYLAPISGVSAKEWSEYVDTAWQVSPQLAVALASRFPGVSALRKLVVQQLVRDVWRSDVQELPEAALLLATSEVLSPTAPELWALSVWAPGDAALGLQLISSPAGKIPVVKEYAVRCLENTPPDKVTFFLSQLVQCLREDDDSTIAGALKHMAGRSDLFAHQLVWALRTEEKPPDEAMNPEVKRSGWQPPRDYGLWDVSGKLCAELLAGLPPDRLAYFEAEEHYFDQVTSISGILKKVEKDKRRAAIAAELVKFSVPRPDLYVPTNPHCRVIKHIPTSGAPMQSAAKVPILVAFKVEDLDVPVADAHVGIAAPTAGAAGLHRSAAGQQQLEAGVQQESTPQTGSPGQNGVPVAAAPAAVSGDAGAVAGAGGVDPEGRTLACIFKVGDDVRQDVLALQVIKLLDDAFHAAGLPAYLKPYGCLPTGYERGIIEVVPRTRSRAALGEVSDSGLYDFFQAEFGDPGSPSFESARQNFITSAAGYAIASYLLQAKDRHNGNLLISNEGHLVHIDFGFILEISPGGNLGFESAAFKLSHEMTQLIDPGGMRDTATWAQFEELCIRAYLVARTAAEPIVATVALMSKSGLPCFGRGAPIRNLRNRFHLEMSERQAAAFMRGIINDAYQKWTTGFYDYIQALQNRIPY